VGFRFRRSIKILPGIRLNISRSGVSASVGVRGAHVTVGHGKVRETVGLPGTGISYTHVEGLERDTNPPDVPADEYGAMPKPIVDTSIDWLQVVSVLGAVAFVAFVVYLAHNR
jgi:hypothetical protein